MCGDVGLLDHIIPYDIEAFQVSGIASGNESPSF